MPESQADTMADSSPLQPSLLAAGLCFLALLLLFHETTWSMISIWMRSDTFAHGFIILPISLWLMWDKRNILQQIAPRPVPWVSLLVLPVGLAWLVGSLVDVLVVQQLALVSMLIVGVWAIIGHELARALAFPLLFLFFSVPMGEALLPSMMDFTASSTVWLIQQTGIPVYREGLYFSLPSGNWSVVEACSGVRYLIASITLGFLFAYLNYRSFWRRFAFVLASAIVPVFANTLRAFFIVMLGHFSDMTVAVGVDHLIYGWIFFGIVIMLMFWVGSFFRDDGVPLYGSSKKPGANQPAPSSNMQSVAVVFLVLTLCAIWPLTARMIAGTSDTGSFSLMDFPVGTGEWKETKESAITWEPDTRASGNVSAGYVSDEGSLRLYIQYAGKEGPVEEVIGSSHRFVVRRSPWRILSRNVTPVQMKGRLVNVDEASINGPGGNLLAWSWYRISGISTSNDYVAKILEAKSVMLFEKSASYRVVVAIEDPGSLEIARRALRAFLDSHITPLEQNLDRAVTGEQ